MKKSSSLDTSLSTLFSTPGYKPLHERDIAKQLRLGAGQRGALRKVLRRLADEGLAAQFGRGKWGPPSAAKAKNELTGSILVRHNGTKIFIPDNQPRGGMPIDGEETLPLLHGDRVLAEPARRPARRMFEEPAGKEAPAAATPVRILRVLERQRKTIVGILHLTPHYAYLVPRDARLGENIRLEENPATLKRHEGRLVAAQLPPPKSGTAYLTATFLKDLGSPEDPRTEIPALIWDHSRSEAFPAAVIRSAQKLSRESKEDISAAPDYGKRVDLRKKLIFTIDPADAHDYDDAISIESLSGGRIRLGVHIADVPAYVTPGSAVDQEAAGRGCTAYLVDRVIRMLPEELTVKTCSIQPREDHLTHSVELEYDAKLNVIHARTFRSIIRSRACLSYERVQQFLDQDDRRGLLPGIPDALQLLDKFTRRLRAARFREGALDFVMPEVHCVLDEKGEPIRFEKRGGTQAYHLVEECMLAANRAVATILKEARYPFISRIHEPPDDEQWARMGEELAAIGVHQAPTSAADINAIIRSVRGRPQEYITTLCILRNLNRAIYAPESDFHFGLAFKRYAHFTSPIRRYPDLLVHRILTAYEQGTPPPYSPAALLRHAAHSSATEREVAEMEAESLRLKRIRYYANLLRKNERGPWEGIITALNPKGLIVELTDTLQSGMLSYAALENGYYVLHENSLSASAGKNKRYQLGQSILVELADVNERLGRVDFRPPQSGQPARKTKPQPKPRRRK